MGLLDDAIREHLDLKRRRGADPAEVERAEREALGPVRRNRDPATDVEAEVDGAPAGSFAYDHGEDEDWSQDPLHEPGFQPAAEVEEPGFDDAEFDPRSPEPEPFIDEAPAPAPRGRGWAGHVDDEPSAEPFRAAGPSSRPLSDPAGGETAEYQVPDALPREHQAPPGSDAEDGEDVLEETPEFLQDTPDHDRLWFEQRPPRDFDFDG